MSNLPQPVWRALDTNGDPISLAELYFYTAGTSNALDTYPTEADLLAGTNANANPVVSDANGLFGEIFLQTDVAYKVVLKSSGGGTTYWTADSINASQLTSSSLVTRVAQIASSPMDVVNGSAVGDGVADESTQVQNAIDNATGVVDLLGKTFRCDSQLVLASGITLRNGTLDFSNCGDTECIIAQGSAGTPVSLSSNSSATKVTLSSVAGIAYDDVIFITSDADFDGSLDHGELARVLSVSGSDVNTQCILFGSYLTADNATATEITTVSNIALENLTIGFNGATSTVGVLIDKCDKVRISDCSIEGGVASSVNIRVLDSLDVVIDGCSMTRGVSTADGIHIYGSSANVLVDDCTIRGQFGSYITVGNVSGGTQVGVARNIDIRNCNMELGTNSTMLLIDDSAQFVTVDKCKIHCLSTGTAISNTGCNTIVTDCIISGVTYGVTHGSATRPSYIEADSLTVRGCFFRDVATVDVLVGTNTANVIIDQCNFNDGVGVQLNGGASKTLDNIAITNCIGDGTAVIEATNWAATTTVNNIRVHGCIGLDSVQIYGIGTASDIDISDNQFDGGGYGVWIQGIASGVTATDIVVENNRIGSATVAGVFFDTVDTAFSNVSVRNNKITVSGVGVEFENDDAATARVDISGNTIASSDTGILVDANALTSEVTIRGNNISATAAIAIQLDGTVTDFAICDNIAKRSDNAASCLNLNGAAASAIKDGVITGNVIIGGGTTAGILVANIEANSIIYDSNRVGGWTTAATSGAGLTAGDNEETA